MRFTPLWIDDTSPQPGLTRDLPREVDVAVIGSGYTGLHAAHALAKHGATVVVLEAKTVGWGASSRNGGMANPGLKLSAPELFHRFGAEQGARLWHWSIDAIDFIEGYIRAEQIECHFARHGQVVLAYKPQHFTALRNEAQWHAKQLNDHAPQPIDPAELPQEIGTGSYFGGLFDPRAAGLHPAKYLFGIAAAAAKAGVALVENAPVTRLSKPAHAYEIITPLGITTANEVLLATNGYTNNLVPAARRGIFSGGSYIVTTEPLAPALQASVSPRGRMFYDTKHFLNYFRLTPDGRMLFGGRHNLSTDLPLEQSAAELRKRLVALFPQLADIPLSHSWTGKLGLTFDLMPHAGRLQHGPLPRVHYAYGYGGHGVAVASYLGHMMGNHLGGKAADVPFFDIPHARYFFTPYERYYLPLVSAWFRFLDRVS